MCKATVDHASTASITIVFINISLNFRRILFVNKTVTSSIIARNYLFHNVEHLKGFQ